RNGLPLHVRSHEGAVGVVVLEEGNERRRHADDLARGNVDIFELFGVDQVELAVHASHDVVADDLALLVDRRVGGGELHHVLFVLTIERGVRFCSSRSDMRSWTVRLSLRKPLRNSSSASSSIVRMRWFLRWSMSLSSAPEFGSRNLRMY